MLSKRAQEILDAPEPVYVRGRVSGGGKVLIILNVVNFLSGVSAIVAAVYAVLTNLMGSEPVAFTIADAAGYICTVGVVTGIVLCFVTAKERRLRLTRAVAILMAIVVMIIWIALHYL